MKKLQNRTSTNIASPSKTRWGAALITSIDMDNVMRIASADCEKYYNRGKILALNIFIFFKCTVFHDFVQFLIKLHIKRKKILGKIG